VQNLHDVKKVEETIGVSSQKKSEKIAEYIIKERDHLISFGLVKKWKEDIKANGKIACPNEVLYLLINDVPLDI